MSRGSVNKILNFDIDTYLNPIVPPPFLSQLPSPVAHFLGYCPPQKPDNDPPNLLKYVHIFVSTLAGLSVASAVLTRTNLGLETTIPSLGASAILYYNVNRSPVAQPRNAIFGTVISAIIGVAVAKGFNLYSHDVPMSSELTWVSSAIACACASVAMSMTNTVHPPGGATAIIASTTIDVERIGWKYVACMLVASVLMCAVACLLENIGRRYPTHWWTPVETGSKWKRKTSKGVDEVAREDDSSASDSHSGSSSTLEEGKMAVERIEGAESVSVSVDRIVIAPGVELDENDLETLLVLQEKLRSRAR